MGELTTRQQRIIDFIGATLSERGYPPTVREIGEAVGLTSSSSVHSQLDNLEKAGLIKRDPTKPRAIMLADGPEPGRAPAPHVTAEGAGVPVPLVGTIAAGAPVLAAEDVEEYLPLPQAYTGAGENFALNVRGDSMIDAGIFDGDIVVIAKQDRADDGDIVAVLLPGPAEDEATVKRFRREGGRAMLVPENPTMEPFEMTDGRILGKVTAVLRKV